FQAEDGIRDKLVTGVQTCALPIYADTLGPTRDFTDSPLKAGQGFWRDSSLDLWSVSEAESEELPLLRSGHRTFGLVHFEFELLRSEERRVGKECRCRWSLL